MTWWNDMQSILLLSDMIVLLQMELAVSTISLPFPTRPRGTGNQLISHSIPLLVLEIFANEAKILDTKTKAVFAAIQDGLDENGHSVLIIAPNLGRKYISLLIPVDNHNDGQKRLRKEGIYVGYDIEIAHRSLELSGQPSSRGNTPGARIIPSREPKRKRNEDIGDIQTMDRSLFSLVNSTLSLKWMDFSLIDNSVEAGTPRLAIVSNSMLTISDSRLEVSPWTSAIVISGSTFEESATQSSVVVQKCSIWNEIGEMGGVVETSAFPDIGTSPSISIVGCWFYSLAVLGNDGIGVSLTRTARKRGEDIGRISASLIGCSFVNMSSIGSSRPPQLSHMTQKMLGCVVSLTSSHLSGSTIRDVNNGGSLLCSNSSFSSLLTSPNTDTDQPTLVQKPGEYTADDYEDGTIYFFERRHGSKTTSVMFSNCTFTGENYRTDYYPNRPIVFSQFPGPVSIISCSFTNFIDGDGQGGAVLVELSPTFDGIFFTATLSNFTNCSTRWSGGAMFLSIAGAALIESCRFENCSAKNEYYWSDPELGGGLYIYGYSSLRTSHISTQTSLSFNLHSSLDEQASSTLSSCSSVRSAQTSLPSQQLSSNSQNLTSEQFIFHADSISEHSHQLFYEIHLHIARHRPTPFPWDVNPSFDPESELDARYQPTSQIVDLNEKFDVSLFAETDDRKIVASLRRCGEVVEATQSADCIVDIPAFRTLLISGINSSNYAIQQKCFFLFIDTEIGLQRFDDPREDRFKILRTAFRDNMYFGQLLILRLWVRWFFFKVLHTYGEKMKESDFDFKGFLAADLSDPSLFDQACRFVASVFLTDSVSMNEEWRINFLHLFEMKHQMMSRLSSDPILYSLERPSSLYLTPFAITLGSFLSIHRGCDFPSALTEFITIDQTFSPHRNPDMLTPAYFLSHTSIALEKRPCFFPMDLMFERYLRDNPDAFLQRWPGMNVVTSSRFLHTSYIGLHSLFLRSARLHLDKQAIFHLFNLLFVDSSGQETTQLNILNLFRYFPPPRFIDTLLSSPHIIRAEFDLWFNFLFLFYHFGVLSPLFGACSSLATIFKMLIPFRRPQYKKEQLVLWAVGELVVSHHWLSIPAHFDSPLICHLPSLAGAQRGILQTLSTHSGIPSLVTPLTIQSINDQLSHLLSQNLPTHNAIGMASLDGRYFAAEGSYLFPITSTTLVIMASRLLSPFPALASAGFEYCLRYVSFVSDADRVQLVKRGLLDCVMLAVSNSSFLDDYEKGVAVIGMLLAAIRRDHQNWILIVQLKVHFVTNLELTVFTIGPYKETCRAIQWLHKQPFFLNPPLYG
ncbi:hypothetical protein BLNAU_10550 [Blattamonas nauphoetae]|uniref:Uncharacterized protein n=1 Tax=Blattamonas nauphoetae TaxID=2049346 RepID=A0ABQ9XRX5_9EUKA|nr:hypothetical protein BLNAU_10550 [Blattamonas nauphoetae]